MLMRRRTLIAAGASAPLLALAGPARAEDLYAGVSRLSRFVGTWRGEGDGKAGHSIVERSYESDLGGQFLVARSQSTYAPQEKNPKGEVHREVGYYSWDKARKRLICRQFHGEGFVVHYVSLTPALDSRGPGFESEAIENIPAGYRARESYAFTGNDMFEEWFELAEPGKDYEIYTHNRLRRV